MEEPKESTVPNGNGLSAAPDRDLLLLATIGALVKDVVEVMDGPLPSSGKGEPLLLPGIRVLDRTLREEAERILDRYDDDTFWHELIHRMGERDFERRATDEELSALDAGGPYPERVAWHYDVWKRETGEHGIERIEIVDDDEFRSREEV